MVEATATAWAFGIQFVATLMGVLVAFGLDHWATDRRGRAARAEREKEYATTLGNLTDSVTYNLSVLQKFDRQSLRPVQRAIAEGFRLGPWEANRERFMDLCRDIQTRTDFAVFFDDIRTVRDLCVYATEYSKIQGPGTVEWGSIWHELKQAQWAAQRTGKRIVKQFGTDAQKRVQTD